MLRESGFEYPLDLFAFAFDFSFFSQTGILWGKTLSSWYGRNLFFFALRTDHFRRVFKLVQNTSKGWYSSRRWDEFSNFGIKCSIFAGFLTMSFFFKPNSPNVTSRKNFRKRLKSLMRKPKIFEKLSYNWFAVLFAIFPVLARGYYHQPHMQLQMTFRV